MFIRVLRGKISQLLRRCTAGGDATLFLKQQLPAITLQFFQGNIFMTIAVTLPTIAVDPSACGHNTPSSERYRFR